MTEVGDPQGWALTILEHSPDLKGQLGCSNHCLDQGFPAHQPAHTGAAQIAMPHMFLTYHMCHRVWGDGISHFLLSLQAKPPRRLQMAR